MFTPLRQRALWGVPLALTALALEPVQLPMHFVRADSLHAQAPSPTPAASPAAGNAFDKLHFRSIGPATMSGRISDVAVYEANPAVYYVGTAHGGVWKTVNNGTTFTPQFQTEGLIAIGDVEVSQRNADLVWVGAGESNNRQSTSWGGGIYKSTNGGRTFALMGLPNSKHINRILIHPRNEDIVWVAATGPLFGPGGDRGVYKTIDGGKSWTRVLAGDDDTGANDIAMQPDDPNVLYASLYQRRRTACCMNGGGTGSAMYKSVNGGESWTKVTGGGFPAGTLGRISMDVARSSPRVVYATVEGPSAPGRPAGAEGVPAAPTPPTASVTGTYRSDDGGVTWTKTSSANARPMYFSQIRVDPTNPDRVYMGGVGLHLSLDGGKTFETDAALVTHDDIHAIWVNPKNPDHVLTGNDGGLAVSYDLAKTWQFIPNLPVGLFYHVSFDMEWPYNICGGMQDNYNWCGPSASRHNRGIFNHDWFQILGGDGFVAIPDQRDSRIIYTESQDGNIIRRNKITGESRSIRPTALNVSNATPREAYRFHWDTPLMFSPHDPGTLLAAANKVFRSRNRGDSWEAISPDLTQNASRDTITTMGQRGRDITIARNDGISQWPSIVALAESPKQRGVFYAGTDDGTVSVTRDDGKTWQNITYSLPGFPTGHAFVSEVVPSRFDAATVYVTVDNHRQNDYQPYIWVSTDYGVTFRTLAATLAGEVVRTLTEDTRNPDVLYVGTETGIFLSIDRGLTWRRLRGNMPTVRVDELTIHPRDNALLVATHGRALWVLDHLEPIQEYAAAQQKEAALFTPGITLQWKSKDDRNDEFWGHQFFTGENPPTEAVLQMHFRRPVTNPVLRISDAKGAVVRELVVPTNRNAVGIQSVCWDQRVEPVRDGNTTPPAGGPGGPANTTPPRRPIPGYPEPLPAIGYDAENPCAGAAPRPGAATLVGPMVKPGRYTVALLVDGKEVDSKPLTLVMDPQVQLTADQRTAYDAAAMELHGAQQNAMPTVATLTALMGEVNRAATKLDSLPTAPDSVKTQFTAFRRDFDALRAKFGVGAPAAGGPGGGGAAAAAANEINVLGRVATTKTNVLAVWEVPSEALRGQSRAAREALQVAIREAEGFTARAQRMSAVLASAGVAMAAEARK
ncbi:WD40/YVTN/BNR-like repeat-containing protein [Gemmatimonas aurantiaca]|nr:sialidase family protein [Gemmatimonas aurantiaca]